MSRTIRSVLGAAMTVLAIGSGPISAQANPMTVLPLRVDRLSMFVGATIAVDSAAAGDFTHLRTTPVGQKEVGRADVGIALAAAVIVVVVAAVVLNDKPVRRCEDVRECATESGSDRWAWRLRIR